MDYFLASKLFAHHTGARLFTPLRVLKRDPTLSRVREAMNLLDAPILVGGCGRSGTTLLLSILSCHPAIHAIPNESNAFCPSGYTSLPDLRLPYRTDKLLVSLLERGFDSSEERVCEKTPRNVRAFERVLKDFPRAQAIHIVRDGRDVVLSRHPTNPELRHVAPKRWVEDTLAGLRVREHSRALLVRYEDLVLNYDETVGEICEFLGFRFVDNFKNFPEHARVRSHGAWNATVKPVSGASIGRWQAHKDSEPVVELLQDPRALPLLRELGYDA